MHSLSEQSTFADALHMLERWDAVDAMPRSVLEYLQASDPAQETVKADEFLSWDSPVFGVMPKYTDLGMLPTARRKAEELGYNVLILSTWLQAEASSAAQVISSIANTIERHGLPIEPPACLINGGELLVTVGNQQGMGGRNQEWAVTAAMMIDGSPSIVMGSVDTDGTDGPGHQFGAAHRDVPVLGGGMVDGQTAALARERGIDLWEAQRRHDTSQALWSLDCGVEVSHNISLTDLTVTLITGRGENPNWIR
jgi:glycerate-2-kinase